MTRANSFNSLWSVSSPVGPRKLTSVRQVAIPARLLNQLNLGPGDEVYFALTDGEPRRIVIIPSVDVSDSHEKVGE